MMRAILSFVAGIMLAGPALAQDVSECDWRARADAIVEPWSENSATYANGAIRIAVLDTIEPAAGAFHLLVLHPPFDVIGGRLCTIVSRTGTLGYAGFYFDARSASYDPETGLTISIPAAIYLPEESFQNTAMLHITIDQSTGVVSVRQELGVE